MFALKKETDYAVQLLQFLNKKNDKFVSLREFSEKSGISFWFLQKIARKLNLAGVIEAEQGVKGGYRLQVPAKKLNLYKVFEIMEGKLAQKDCSNCANSACSNYDDKCGVKKITTKLNKDIVKMLQKVKI